MSDSTDPFGLQTERSAPLAIGLFVEAPIAGKKTEQRRDGVYGYPGETFELEGKRFEIVSLTHDRLGDMSEADAQAEGYENMEAYRDLILRMHRGMEWDVEHRVWVHRFRQVG